MNGDRSILKGIQLCGSQSVKMPMLKPAVFLVKNDKSASFTLSQHCHSTWSCPYCTPRVMARKGAEIACQIDALAKWKNEYAFMVTLTMPHLNFMSCYQSYQILLKAWDNFTRYKARNRHKNKDGTISVYELKGHFPQFKHELGIINMVRVYEFTWGINSWHPHLHILMWTHKKNWNKVLSYEDMLRKAWWTAVRKAASEVYTSQFESDPQKAKKIFDELFADYKNDKHSLWISKDKHGKLIQQKSSHYITGWSGDMELTGEQKKIASFGHYTPQQILQAAYDNKNFPQIRDDLLGLYIEYAVATRGHRRVEFSNKKEARELREKWKHTNEYIMAFKKKAMDRAKKQVVCWFDAQQWSHLSWLNLITTDIDIKATIIQLALQKDAKEQIENFLNEYDIQCHFEPYSDESIISSILTYLYEREHVAEKYAHI